MKTIYLHGFTGDKYGLESFAHELDFPDTVLIDLPSFGTNTHNYSLNWSSYIEAVEKSLPEIDKKEGIRIVGHSYGCMVAYGLAAKYPGLVKELILLCPVAKGSLIQRIVLRINTVLLSAISHDALAKFYRVPVVVHLVSALSWRPSWPSGALTRIMAMRLRESQRYSGEQLRLLSLVREFKKNFQATHIGIPTLIVQASADDIVSRSDKRWYQGRTRAELLHVKGGHLAPIARVKETAQEITKRYTTTMSELSSKPKTLKVIIMTAAFGAGHITVAKHLTKLLGTLDQDVKIKTIDVIADAWPWFGKASAKTYATSTSNSTFWFKVYYYLTDKFPAPLRWFGYAIFYNYAKRKYAQEQPDLIVSTFPFMADIAASARDANQGQAPVVQVVTDAGNVQGIWISKRGDMTFTATPDTVEYLKKRGMDSDKVVYAGFPLPPQRKMPDKHTLRKSLGLDEECFTILLTAGGQGLGLSRALDMAKALASIDKPYQLILNAGSNDELKKAFHSMSFTHAKKVIITGFTDKFHEHMAASDVACTKAGWLTIQEAIVLGTPLVIYNAIPGHEEQNVHFVESRELGIFSNKSEKCVDFIVDAMQKPEKLSFYHQNMRSFMKQSDSGALTRTIKGLLR